MKTTTESQVNRYLGTYTGKSFASRLDEYGTWKVLGEDPNCDFAGYHVSPHIATMKGTLREVMAKAVKLPGFWQWGAGGDFIKIDVEEITPKNRKARIAELKAIIEKAQVELDTLEA